MGMCFGREGEGAVNSTPERKLMRILMLGIGGSGKSTVTQQLRILHNPKSKERAFTAEEIANYAEVIVKNLYSAFEILLRDYKGEDNEGEAHEFFRDYRAKKSELDHLETMQTAKDILDDADFKKLCLTPGIYSEIPTLHHYIKQYETVLDQNYVPTDEDIICCKQRTVGIARSRFKRDKLVWEIIDAGGQPVERKKWDRILEEEIRAVIFVVAVNEFDVADKWLGKTKDEKKIRLETARETFKKVIDENGENLDNVILFLNKIDIFKEKLSTKEGKKMFKSQFPDFEGDLKDKEQKDALKFLEDRFLNEIPDEEMRSSVVVHPTIAVNSENIKIITDTVFAKLFADRMRVSGVVI